MYNPLDTRQIRALVEYRWEQVATDAARYRGPVERRRRDGGLLTWTRVAIGRGLIRAGARVAGMYPYGLPYLRHGV